MRENQVTLLYPEGHFLTTDELPGTVFPQEDIIAALQLLLLVLLQQLADELLGQLAGVAEELLIELVIHAGDVPQGVLLGLSQERRRAAQPGAGNTEGGVMFTTAWSPLRDLALLLPAGCPAGPGTSCHMTHILVPNIPQWIQTDAHKTTFQAGEIS